MDDFESLDATGQAQLVRSGQVSAAELVEAAITRIEQRNPALNAVIWPLFEGALDASRTGQPSGAFAGVPFLMKDLGAGQAGQPQAMGNRALRDLGHRTQRDSVLGARFRSAGLITVGKTNTPEFGMSPTTEPLAFGPTRNPWRLDRSTNGSSGGSCAAVAAGLVPIAHASDGAGSIRLPAAWCGVVGLKPSRGRVPLPPGLLTSRTVSEFVVCRSVRDAAAMLDAVHGGVPGGLFQTPRPDRSFTATSSEAPPHLRIGLAVEHDTVEVHPQHQRAVAATGDLLAALGHDVVGGCRPPVLHEPPPVNLRLVLRAMTGANFIQLGRLLERPVQHDDVEPLSWHMANLPIDDSAGAFLDATEFTQAWAERVSAWWDDAKVDVLVTPTVPQPPCELGWLTYDAADPNRAIRRSAATFAFTAPFNTTGEPAISLPLHQTHDGLPLGMQFATRHGGDGLLLQLAGQLEQAAPWDQRKPQPTADS